MFEENLSQKFRLINIKKYKSKINKKKKKHDKIVF